MATMMKHILVVAQYRAECGDVVTALWCDIQPWVINVFRNLSVNEANEILEHYDWQNGIAVDSPRELLGELYRMNYDALLREKIKRQLPPMLDKQA